MIRRMVLLLCCFSVSTFAEVDQLFVMTTPKSGTFLAARAIKMLTGISIVGDVMNHKQFSEQFLLKHPKIATTAHLVECFEPLRTNPDVKKILVVRDLRDVCVSALYWLRKNDWYSHSINHSRFYQMDFEGQLSYMIDINHDEFSIKSFANRVIKWRDTPGVLTIRFEDLVGEQGGGTREFQIQALKSIADYLEVEVSLDDLNSVADNLWGSSATFRTGKTGNWRESFAPQHKELFKQVMGEELIELGYEKDNTWE